MLSFDSGPFCFGDFELNSSTRELRKHGLRVRVKPQAMTLLCLLVEQPIRTRTREEIQRRLWPENTFVDFEHSLNKVVHTLREALEDSASKPRFVETVATQGYRFVSQSMKLNVKSVRGSTDDGPSYLAVLPIGVEGGAELTFLAGRITSLITDQVSTIDGVRVIAEGAVKHCKLSCSDPVSVGMSLGVQAVLSGQLVRHNGWMYLRVELIDIRDGRLLHGAEAEAVRQPHVPLAMELSREIVRQLSSALSIVSRKPMDLPERMLALM